MKKIALAITLSLTAVFGLQAQKLSGNAQSLLLGLQPGGHTAMARLNITDSVDTEVKFVRAILDLNDTSVLDSVRMLGGQVFSTRGMLASAQLPVGALQAISELDGINFIEMGSPVHKCMDVARRVSRIDEVHVNPINELPRAYYGEGVVVGVIDNGLDYTHSAFLNADGSASRIKRVWNQHLSGKAPEKFGYGAEYTTPDQIKAAKTDLDTEFHGTHTTNIVAGGDLESGYYGSAIDADIVYVSFGQNSADIPNAVEYIFDYAESVGKPCVINMSLGSHYGPHDGSSAMDRYFDELVGPGRILVGAVGNEGGETLHVGKTFTSTDTQLKTMLGIPSGNNKNTIVDIWGSPESDFTLQLVVTDVKGKVVEQSEVFSTAEEWSSSKLVAFMDNVDCYFRVFRTRNASTDAPNIYAECYITTVGETRNIGFIVKGSEGNTVNMWNVSGNAFVNAGARGWTAGDNSMTCGEIGGTGKSVISVGSYTARLGFPIFWISESRDSLYSPSGYAETLPLGELSYFSSRGPTADGRMKPEVLAPGAFVVSAMNNNISGAANYSTWYTVDKNNKTNYYIYSIGTSMAAPVVSGGVALWLEANPELTPDDVYSLISKSAYMHPTYTSGVPDNNNGFGWFDAYEGIKELTGLSAVDEIGADAKDEAQSAWVEGGSLSVTSTTDSQVDVFTTFGTLVGQYPVSVGMTQIDCSTWTSGVYLVRFASTGKAVKVLVK